MGFFRWLLGIPPKPPGQARPGFPTKGFLMIDEFPGGVALREPGENEAILLVVLRQSGNVQRTEVHTTRAAALKSAQAVFRRMKQIDARIWVNTDLCADLRRPFHHGRGSREGRVTAGVCMEVRSLRN